MSPQEPQNTEPTPQPNQTSSPDDPQLLSSSTVDSEPSTQDKVVSQPEPQGIGEVTDSSVAPVPTPSVAPTTDVAPVQAIDTDTYVPVTPDMSTTSTAPIATAPVVGTGAAAPLAAPKKSRKKLVAIIIAAVIVLLALGGGVAFAVWYTSPQKVLNDSLVNLMNTPPKSADVTAAVSVEDTNFKVSVTSFSDGAGNAQANIKFDVTSGGTAVNINVDAIAAKNGDLYIRINDAKKLVAQFTQGSPEAAEMFEGVLTKVDTKWVKITKADLEKLNNEEKSPDSECVSKAITAFQNDAGQKKEVSDLYAKNQFVTVKEQKADETIDGRNSFHYVLDADEAKAKSFAEGMKQTQIYKKVKDCLGDSFKDEDSNETKDAADDTTTSVEVWIDKSTRQMSKLNLTASSEKDKGSAKIDAILGYKTKSITLPTTTTSLDEVQQEFQNIFGGSAEDDESVLGASIFTR